LFGFLKLISTLAVHNFNNTTLEFIKRLSGYSGKTFL